MDHTPGAVKEDTSNVGCCTGLVVEDIPEVTSPVEEVLWTSGSLLEAANGRHVRPQNALGAGNHQTHHPVIFTRGSTEGSGPHVTSSGGTWLDPPRYRNWLHIPKAGGGPLAMSGALLAVWGVGRGDKPNWDQCGVPDRGGSPCTLSHPPSLVQAGEKEINYGQYGGPGPGGSPCSLFWSQQPPSSAAGIDSSQPCGPSAVSTRLQALTEMPGPWCIVWTQALRKPGAPRSSTRQWNIRNSRQVRKGRPYLLFQPASPMLQGTSPHMS